MKSNIMTEKALIPQFVKTLPDVLEEGILYISMEYATAAHKCVCGCGLEVVTPFSPVQWELTFNGVSVSLDPSIGNWSFPCESHYWIIRNKIRWAPKWSKERIKAGREYGALRNQNYLDIKTPADIQEIGINKEQESVPRKSFWQRLKEKFF
jgi:hypothetical protein